MSHSTPALLRRRQMLVKQLARLEPLILRGSLIERYKPCGKPGCKCARGRGHGPKYYLSVSHYGRQPQMDYLSQDYQSQASECLARLNEVAEERGGRRADLDRQHRGGGGGGPPIEQDQFGSEF